ncbi:NUDIX domain-containing protein [Streptomyces mirabilis]
MAVIVDGGRLLLVRRSVAEGELLWALPGGKVEADETAAEAAVREAQEEPGGSPQRGAGPGRRTAPLVRTRLRPQQLLRRVRARGASASGSTYWKSCPSATRTPKGRRRSCAACSATSASSATAAAATASPSRYACCANGRK